MLTTTRDVYLRAVSATERSSIVWRQADTGTGLSRRRMHAVDRLTS